MSDEVYTYRYPRPSLTADVVLFTNDRTEILLVKRGNEPFLGCWALPGGFFDMDDVSIEATARRELKEETSVDVDRLELLCVASAKGRDPRGRTVSVVFTASVAKESVCAKGGDDAAEARWFGVENLPPLAFDHEEIVARALEKD